MQIKMWSNSRLPVLSSFIIVIAGFVFLWFGFQNGIQISHEQTAVITAPVTSPPTTTATASATYGIEGKRVFVSKVIDGDTIALESSKTVRFIGIDTPETVDPRRIVGCFGKEASNEVKKLLTGKVVILQKDTSDTDKYGRLLRFIFLPLENGEILFVNDYLVREGFARAKNYAPDVKFKSRFAEAEIKAKEAKKGLWGKCI
ncbi:thermonuclease family protein [Patescibacteria group bacterium]|nr:thermonuclease family protein [Patescibacteria group bacterium]